MFPTIEITARGAEQIQKGSLWIFSNEVLTRKPNVERGAWCHFVCRGEVVATGYFNPNSLIAGRVVARGRRDDIGALLNERILAAFDRRKILAKENSARLIFSEADFLPGIVLDRFIDGNEHVAVLQSSTAGIDKVMDELVKLIPPAHEKIFGNKLTGLVVRADTGVRRLEGVDDFSKIIFGDEKKIREATFIDSGVRYAADFLEGQKTGFFLDQRDNRAFLREWIHSAPNKKVLDLFCYSGGWGLAALQAGAESVTFVDESKPALALVQRGVEINGFQSESVKTVASDVFDFLDKETEMFDVIVADPPAFVKSKIDLSKATRAYEKLNRLCWRRLKPGGVLISCSCSYHLHEPEFFEMLRAAVAKEKSQAHVVYRGFQAKDHPVLLAMPETAYLKCAALQKISS